MYFSNVWASRLFHFGVTQVKIFWCSCVARKACLLFSPFLFASVCEFEKYILSYTTYFSIFTRNVCSASDGDSFLYSFLSNQNIAVDWSERVFKTRRQQLRTLQTFARINLWPWALTVFLSVGCGCVCEREREGNKERKTDWKEAIVQSRTGLPETWDPETS